jgi:class 3 adenylate cyclase
VEGFELHADELPHFFAELLKGEEIDAADAGRDPRTAELHRVVMAPLGSRSLIVVPVRRDDRVVGAVGVEDASERTGVKDFLRAVSNMVAQRLADDTEAPAPAPVLARDEAAPAAASSSNGARSFTSQLGKLDIDAASMDGEIHTGVAVMVLHFTDPVAMAMRAGPLNRSVSDEIACALQEVAGKHDIPYLKILGQDVVAAAGLGPPDARAPLLIAELAVAVRDRCIALFEASDRPQEFRIGIDCGAAIGGMMGANPKVFNLWGDAVRTAATMAGSALPGTVQATEAAYERLRQVFLFRPRGSFYLPHFGEARTFVLAGRL